MKPGLYWWVRCIDETGMSGTGVVGQVAVFDDQSAVFRWLKSRNKAGVSSYASYENIEDLKRVHGHGKSENFAMVPVLSIGEGVLVTSMENWSATGFVVEVDLARTDSFYRIKPESGQPEVFWAWNWEVERDSLIIGDRSRKVS